MFSFTCQKNWFGLVCFSLFCFVPCLVKKQLKLYKGIYLNCWLRSGENLKNVNFLIFQTVSYKCKIVEEKLVADVKISFFKGCLVYDIRKKRNGKTKFINELLL